jgi:hypothetical protein
LLKYSKSISSVSQGDPGQEWDKDGRLVADDEVEPDGSRKIKR